MPVETSAGETIAFVSSATNSLEMKTALKYFEECRKLFQFEDVGVLKKGKEFVLEAPSTADLFQIMLLHKIVQATPGTMPDVVFFSPLDASSVTHEGLSDSRKRTLLSRRTGLRGKRFCRLLSRILHSPILMACTLKRWCSS
jgi:hypothetical protein